MAQIIDRIYIVFGLLWLIFGMCFGIWMGMSENFQYTNPHAHANLVGFVASAIFGLVFALYPALKASRLALPQFFVYQAGAVLLVWGKIIVSDDPTNLGVVVTGSLVVLVGTLLFAALFIMRGARTA